MNRLTTLSLAAMFVAGAAVTAPTMIHAQYTGGSGGTNQGANPGMEHEGTTGGYGSQGSTGSMHEGTTGAMREGQELGEHQMSGTISSINHDKGTVDLKTSEETLKLHFPPQAIRDLKQGDKITVSLGFYKSGMTQGSAR